MRLASLRARDAVALLAAAAVAALFAVAATSLGRGEALLLQWGARDGKAFIWGPPTMRPDRQALSLGGTRGGRRASRRRCRAAHALDPCAGEPKP